MMVVPVVVLQKLASEAEKRGITMAQFLGSAIGEYLKNHPVEEG